jgi:antitoxin CptB
LRGISGTPALTKARPAAICSLGSDEPKTGPAPVAYCAKAVAMEMSEEMRRRRLRFRVWHRGMREVDLILGRFADARLATMPVTDLGAFEALLDTPDQDVLGWVMGDIAIPTDSDTPFLRQLIAFHRGAA